MSARPDFVVATGDYLEEWMTEQDVSGAELARRLGVSRKHVSELLSGKATLSQAVSIALSDVTGVPARIWNLYESAYREELARRAAADRYVAQHDEASQFPLKYLRELGVITANSRDKAGTVRELLDFFGVASIDAWRRTWSEGSVAYRRTTVDRDDAREIAVWLTIAERETARRDVSPYDAAALRALLPTLRALTAAELPSSIASAVELLARVGVALCFVPPVPGLGVYGATRWMGGTPILQLSLLRKTDDQLWFTLFHEIGHVLLHGDDHQLHLGDDGSDAELEANQFASDLLIPREFLDRLPLTRNIGAVEELAKELGIAPSIVLGRAQREMKDFAWGHKLKRKLNFASA
ncbi:MULTISPECIES: ImmA/IrrE family metallo-endopeptidase [Curtobacterium]|uniref:ImmA/IrrE family metallo-endopeptidase n=1 Tax=Curtobacterium TaxID=2034 RepID=UPI001E4608B2|nr:MULTISPECIES: ImmA/IrrE family metallo-endopeptidase [Curtobacterium]